MIYLNIQMRFLYFETGSRVEVGEPKKYLVIWDSAWIGSCTPHSSNNALGSPAPLAEHGVHTLLSEQCTRHLVSL